jgi:hypothetical protein
MMLNNMLVRVAGALAACVLLSGLLTPWHAAAATTRPAALSNVEIRDGTLPAPLPPVYAIRGDELQALRLREQSGGLSTEERADVQELRRRGALPPALPAPLPEAESVRWWIGYVLFFPLGITWLALTVLPWWVGLTLGALVVVRMWRRPVR